MKHPINKERIALGKNPANCVLLRGCGSCIDVSTMILNKSKKKTHRSNFRYQVLNNYMDLKVS